LSVKASNADDPRLWILYRASEIKFARLFYKASVLTGSGRVKFHLRARQTSAAVSLSESREGFFGERLALFHADGFFVRAADADADEGIFFDFKPSLIFSFAPLRLCVSLFFGQYKSHAKAQRRKDKP
jgi:hypothetical protein